MATKNYAHLDSVTGLVLPTELPALANRTITGTANQIDVTNGDGVAGNPVLAGRYGTIKVSKTFADFSTAGLVNTINLIAMPAKTKVVLSGLGVNTIADSVVTLGFDIGIIGNLGLFTSGADGQTLTPTSVPLNGNESEMILPSYTVVATATAVGANLDTVTQGAWDFYISYEIYP